MNIKDMTLPQLKEACYDVAEARRDKLLAFRKEMAAIKATVGEIEREIYKRKHPELENTDEETDSNTPGADSNGGTG